MAPIPQAPPAPGNPGDSGDAVRASGAAFKGWTDLNRSLSRTTPGILRNSNAAARATMRRTRRR